MNVTKFYPIDILNTMEEDRQRMLAKEVVPPENFQPGTYGWHEAVDRTVVMIDMVGNHLLDHPAILLEKEMYYRVWAIQDELCTLFQQLAAKDHEQES